MRTHRFISRWLAAWLIAATCTAGSAQGQAKPAVTELLRSLDGEWSGALGYRDYQSNRLFELPVRTWIENVPDGATQVRRSLYDEGPGLAPVWIVSLLQSGKDGVVATAIMRSGREPELIRDTSEVRKYDGPDNWVIVSSRTGTDDDKPSDIRVTETRNGPELLSVKEVRPAGERSAPWKFRNQVRLKRRANQPVAPAASVSRP